MIEKIYALARVTVPLAPPARASAEDARADPGRRARGARRLRRAGPRRLRRSRRVISGSSASSSSGVVDLTWQTMWSGNTLTLLNQMVNEFNATHPDIHVTESNIPSATGDAKLLSEIAAGDPPDVFTEWNPVLGEYAADGTIQSMAPYLTGTYSGLEKWLYPIALQGGEYNGTLYALPMGMNSWALYYNKSMLKAAGISSPPTTLAQLYADQAKEWKISGGKLEQIGFYPSYNQGMEYFDSFFGAVNCFDSSGKYDLASCPGAQAEANFLASYDNYPYSLVQPDDLGLVAAQRSVQPAQVLHPPVVHPAHPLGHPRVPPGPLPHREVRPQRPGTSEGQPGQPPQPGPGVPTVALDRLDHVLQVGPLPRVEHLVQQRPPVREMPVEPALGHPDHLRQRLDPYRVQPSVAQRSQALLHPPLPRRPANRHRLSFPSPWPTAHGPSARGEPPTAPRPYGPAARAEPPARADALPPRADALPPRADALPPRADTAMLASNPYAIVWKKRPHEAPRHRAHLPPMADPRANPRLPARGRLGAAHPGRPRRLPPPGPADHLG